MLASLDVKGEATEASESDNAIPAWAALRAPQSFAPSPHIPKNDERDLTLTIKKGH